MTEETENQEPAPAPEEPKRKRIIRRRRVGRPRMASVEPKPERHAKTDDEFAGMGVGNWPCADRCKDGICYITGQAKCGSPLLQGLQHEFKNNAEIVARFNRAKAYIEHIKIDAKNKK